MDRIITEERGLIDSVKCVEAIAQENEQSTGAPEHAQVTGLQLTVTQVAIPSPTTEVPTQENEGGTSPCDEDEPMEPTSQDPVDEPTRSICDSPGASQKCSGKYVSVQIRYAKCPDDKQVIAQVPCGTAIRNLLEAEAALQGYFAQSLACQTCEGDAISSDHIISDDLSMVAMQQGKPQVQLSTQDFQPEKDEVKYVNPLCQVVGKAFVSMIPPTVQSTVQMASLLAQNISSEDRRLILTNQSFVWGDDEIRWHLHRISQAIDEKDEQVTELDPLLAHGWSLHGTGKNVEAKEWVESLGARRVIITVLLHRGHWIPISFRFIKRTVSVTFLQTFETDQEAVVSLSKCFQTASSATDFVLHPVVKNQVPCSCGAEAIRFFEEVVLGWPTPVDPSCDLDMHDQYRAEFCAEISKEFVTRHPWMWGAGKEEEEQAVEKLVPFLREHGVPTDAVKQRANMAVTSIGASEILQACNSKTPWRTLKVLGTNKKFQFVLPMELQSQIEAKAGRGEVGKVGKKVKQNKGGKLDETIELDPHKLIIPDRTFQSEGTFVSQISMAQIGPLATGVAISTMLEAEPFLRTGKYVSQEPLALLVLNAPSVKHCSALPSAQVTIPARCVVNNEPILLEATLVQLGGSKIDKAVHKPAMNLDTVEVATIKMVVYRDEVSIGWEQFIQGPVKYIMSHFPILRLCTEPHCKCEAWHNQEGLQIHSGVVDVWRRQYLRHGFKPESPSTAAMFSVCIRIPVCLKQKVLDQSGHQGVYAEPRSLDAREVDRSYDVIWIPKADKASVMHLRQTNPAAIGVVRNAERYGLRTLVEQAQALHQAIRPEAVYLAQGPRLQFSVGPVPYGADRRALSKAFKALGWEAKPIQPTGAVGGGRGNTWAVHATEPPPSNIMTLGHGDIVISTVKSPSDGKQEVMKPIAATTLNLCGTQTKAAQIKDPWLVKDPWQNFQPSGHTAGNAVPEASTSIRQLENKIEQAVLAKLPAQSPTPMEMDDVPDRVDTLERQVQTLMQKQQQLEVKVTENHVQQSAQMTQLQGQLQAQG